MGLGRGSEVAIEKVGLLLAKVLSLLLPLVKVSSSLLPLAKVSSSDLPLALLFSLSLFADFLYKS